MATLATTFVRKSEVRCAAPRREDRDGTGRVRPDTDPYQLRPLPGEDIFLYAKHIENAKVVRVADPRSRGAALSAAGVMCVLAALLTGSVAPRLANYIAGYRIETLRQERQRLIDESMVLDVEVAKMLRLDRLEELAHRHNLVPPKAGQYVELETRADPALASLEPKAQ
jgi:cell division protein FtsL